MTLPILDGLRSRRDERRAARLVLNLSPKDGYCSHEPVHHPHHRLPQPHRAPTARRPGPRVARRRAPRPRRGRVQPFQRGAARRLGPLPAEPARASCGARCRPTTSCWSTQHGTRLAGRHEIEPTAMFIHAAVHRIAGKACVLHTHMPFATALTLTADRGLDTTLSQNAMRFHGRIAIDAAVQRPGARRVRRRAHRARDERRRRGVSRQPRRGGVRRRASTTRTTTCTTSSAPACTRCWRSRPGGR